MYLYVIIFVSFYLYYVLACVKCIGMYLHVLYVMVCISVHLHAVWWMRVDVGSQLS